MRIILFILSLFVANSSLFAQTEQSNKLQQLEASLVQIRANEQALLAQMEALKLEEIRAYLKQTGYPESKDQLEIVEHSAMVIGYNPRHKQAAWVFHQLIPDVSFGSVSRTNDFRPDPKLQSQSAVEEDYFLKFEQADGTITYDGFGFDRGHLAPSADFRWSEQALSESYYYSNMTPQRPGFNRESWAEVEDLLRSIVDNEQKRFYVLTGPVLRDDLPVVERSINQVSIPELHYKIIVDTDPANPRGLAFLMPNRKAEYPAASYVVSIDSVEKVTGLNFFPRLDPDMEAKIEGKSNYTAWRSGTEDKEVNPIHPEKLPKGYFNTIQAQYHQGARITVVGKVVSARYVPRSESTFLNLDRVFPNQVFTITIWKDGRRNFSYKPEEVLNGQYIEVTGKVSLDREGIPTINVSNEKQIKIWRGATE
jgi:endonuclease G, mitochondrial